MKVRLTSEPDGRICLESPYERGFVEGLKAALPWEGRAWEPTRKRWLISALYETELHAFCTQESVDIVDDRLDTAPRLKTVASEHADMPEDLHAAMDTLYVATTAPLVVCEASWKALSRIYHPDNREYGDAEKAMALNDAIDTVRRYLAPVDMEDDIPF